MRYLRSPKIRIFFLLVCLVSLVGLAQSLYSIWLKRDIVEDRRKVLAQRQAENTRLKEEYIQVQQPEYVEKQAREKLGLVKPGEIVVLMEKSKEEGNPLE